MNIYQCLIINQDNHMNQHCKYEKIKLDIKLDMIFCLKENKKWDVFTQTRCWYMYSLHILTYKFKQHHESFIKLRKEWAIRVAVKPYTEIPIVMSQMCDVITGGREIGECFELVW